MNLIKNEDNNFNDNKIIKIINLIETISNNYILKFKYIFLDILLNEWYMINKTILKEKIDDYTDINSILIYNSYKSILYIIINIFNKHKIKYYLHLNNIYHNIYLKEKYLKHIIDNNKSKNIIKKEYWNIFKCKINDILLKEEIGKHIIISFDKKNNVYETLVKNLFIDKFYYYNILFLRKEFSIKKLCAINNYNENEKIIMKNNCYLYLIKWINYSLKNMENQFSFYYNKIKFCQCNNIIYIYKRKLRNIYNIFINNYKVYYSYKFNNNEKKIKNEVEASSLIYLLKNIFIRRKKNIYIYFISFYYTLTKDMILLYSFLNIINKYLIRFKNIFMVNFKRYYNNRVNNIKYMYFILSKIIMLYKSKKILLFFNLMKRKVLNESYNNNIYVSCTKNIINKKKKENIKNYGFSKNRNNLIKLIVIYDKKIKQKNLIINQNLINYLYKWKIITKQSLYNNLLQNKYLIKNKIQKYTKKNELVKNQLLQMKAIIDKTLFNNNDYKGKRNKNKINNNINNNNKSLKNNSKKDKEVKEIKEVKQVKEEEKEEKEIKEDNLLEKIMISENKTIDSNEFDDYFDELPMTYLDNLENLKNKNEPIITDLQCQINKLLNDIENLSNDI